MSPSQGPLLPVHISLMWLKVSDTRNTKKKQEQQLEKKSTPCWWEQSYSVGVRIYTVYHLCAMTVQHNNNYEYWLGDDNFFVHCIWLQQWAAFTLSAFTVCRTWSMSVSAHN